MLDVLQALNAALGRSVEIVNRSPEPVPFDTVAEESPHKIPSARMGVRCHSMT